MPGIFNAPPTGEIARRLRTQVSRDLESWSDEQVQAYLADAVYLERRRFSEARDQLDDHDRADQEAIEDAARAVTRSRVDHERALLTLVDRYADEIHNTFSSRTHKVATGMLPGMLTRLLTTASPSEFLGRGFDPESRIAVTGDLQTLRRLAETHTLILAPTHLSNLDSPILGYALHTVGLPPFIYGAGLNLFSNKLMSFFMSRLGAYTVDRRKGHRLYKDVLKAYSVDALGRRCHSLFFPGGTRARSGAVETKLKKGLLGTGILAWQDGLEQGRPNPDVLVVPATLSFALVLEAETLIEDALKAVGRSRYIISDDEFSQPRTVASFGRRVLNLDASAHVHLGTPLDLLGNPVDPDGNSLGPGGQVLDRKGYVTDRSGAVVRDPQRDRMYTAALSEKIADSWARDTVLLPTHVAAYVAWQQLRHRHPRRDTWQLVFLSAERRTLPRRAVLFALDKVLSALDALEAEGRIRTALPGSPGSAERAQSVLDYALSTFSSFHTRHALEPVGDNLCVDTRLALYYGNRVRHLGLDAVARSTATP